jgi:hypothetical protein
VICEIIGPGKMDGRYRDFPEPLAPQWFVPCLKPTRVSEEPDLDTTVSMRVMIYDLDRRPDRGCPACRFSRIEER